MISFNVLDRSLEIHRNYLLEASAGTGKTFSIQNLVIRLLIEPEGEEAPLPLDKILVVTFTRAAARDLKIRIRKNIEEALKWLDGGDDFEADKIPDYLKACLAKGEQAVHLAKKRLRQALFLFDQAQIFTIHAFCARMLRQFSMESDTGLHMPPGDKPFPQSELMAIVRDFFRTEIRKEKFSPSQLENYLKGDASQSKLMKLIQSMHGLTSNVPFEKCFLKFNEYMHDLKGSYSLCSEKMIEDFQKQAPFYSNYSKETKIQTLEKVRRFAKLFDQEQWTDVDLDGLIADGLVWTKALDPSLIKKSTTAQEDLNYPGLTQKLSSTLRPLIEEAGKFSSILSLMAEECRRHLILYQHEEEKLSPDDVLKKMGEALDQPLFFKKVSANYQAVIVDEFQDTDPLQWKIFSCLFLPDDHRWKGYLYLVGDPKQSIYSFRQADIYTYLAAAKAIGEQNSRSLSVNYRSDAPLVQALNLLFAQEHLPSFIPLPKHASDLMCPPVQAAREGELLDDKKGAVHFIVADCQLHKKPTHQQMEKTVFFPYIASEIIRLKNDKNFTFSQFAVLVRDRNQAFRLTEYFREKNIPFVNQRGTSLARSSALHAMAGLIQALLHPHDRGKIFAAFGTPLLGWREEELMNPEQMEFILLLVQRLRSSLRENGFTSFFHDLLHSVCKPNGPTVMEHLLASDNGLDFYRDLQQLADCIADHQFVEWNSPEAIVPFLDQFLLWEENDDERAKRFQDSAKEGVKILSLHMSKGLEFDVVFAIGLINPDEIKEDLIPIESNGQIILTPAVEESAAYKHYCEERDSEKMRQLYVALTRAKHQLYVPALLHFKSEKIKWGEASPIDLFLARLHQPPASYGTLYDRIRKGSGQILIDFIEEVGKDKFITYSIHQEVSCGSADHASFEAPPPLNPPPCVVVSGKAIWMASFTSLSHTLVKEADQRQSLPLPFPNDYGCALKDVHSLPACSETGVIVHRILEKLTLSDFAAFNHPDQAVPLVRPFVQCTPFKEWEQTIARLIFTSVKAKLPSMPSSFSLSLLRRGRLYREMPFLFPYKKGEGIEEIRFAEGLIKGVVDMLFYHDGFYYLLDWKTNWLGPRTDCYDTPSLHAAMQENSYFLQASIYVEAIRRYLKLVDERPFKECFGGVFYLFLRGMQEGNSTTGIYHFFPRG